MSAGKKKMSIRYLPARVVEGKSRWYIVFYQTHPVTHSFDRHRDNPSINRIRDIDERRKYCKKRVKEINNRLPYGYPYEVEYAALPRYQFLIDVLTDIQPLLRRKFPETAKAMISTVQRLIAWCADNAHSAMPVNKFKKVHALDFFYAMGDAGTQDAEILTHLDRLKKVFAELKRGAYIKKNPFRKVQQRDVTGLKERTNILDALEVARKIKHSSMKERSRNTVDSMINIFTDFLTSAAYCDMQVGKFDRKMAIEFCDYAILEREVSARTHNNYIDGVRPLFTELKERGYCAANPFSKLPRKKPGAKKRRAFTEEERDRVSRLIEQDDPLVFLGCLLQYYCFIRPIEQRRLRFRDIDLKLGIIRLGGDQTKNNEADIVTIPDEIIPMLTQYELHRHNQNWLIFGKRGMPHPHKAAGHQLMYLRHKKLLDGYLKKGIITNIEGLTYYSWKDTGAMELWRLGVNPLEIMKQLRHKDLNTTLLYCQSLYYINREIKALRNPIRGISKLTNTAGKAKALTPLG